MDKQSAGHIIINASKLMIASRLVIVGFNLIALAGGIIYLLHPTPYLFWNLYGYAVLLALFGNVVLTCFGGTHRYLD